MKRIEKEDLEHVLNHTRQLWLTHFAKGSTIFLTGGTGFFGKWLIETFLYVNEQLQLDGKLIVLSRNPEAFLNQFPQFNSAAIRFVKGDIRSFTMDDVEIDYIIHAATEASVALNLSEPFLMFDTIVDGTKKILELAKTKKVKAVLHTSSGAVYGKQPSLLTHVQENYIGSPDIYSDSAAYGEGKRVAEMLSNLYYTAHGVPSKIARCFAFIGPYLPLDGHFAVGNFIRNVLNGEQIKINGDGTPYRSYMYASDLAIWLWTILFTGVNCRPYNVGSDSEISIESLARVVSTLHGKSIEVVVLVPHSGNEPLRYVPSIERAKAELNLSVSVTLEEAIIKTTKFNSVI